MGNIIKIPTTNTGLNLENGSPLWDNWVVTDGVVSGQEYGSLSNIPTVTNGGGTGLIVNLYLQLNQQPQYQIEASFSISQVVGYEVGNTVSFEVLAGQVGNENPFTLQTTITESMLSYEGDKMQYLPVFSSLNGIVLTVIPPPTGLNNYWQIPKPWGGHSNCWKININGGTDTNRALITKAINEVFIKAAQAPNSHPTLRLPNGITCSSVDYTFTQIQAEPGPGPGPGEPGSGEG